MNTSAASASLSRLTAPVLIGLFAFADLVPPFVALLSNGRAHHKSGEVTGTGSLTSTHVSSALQTLSWIMVIAAAAAFIAARLVLRRRLGRDTRHGSDVRGFMALTVFLAVALLCSAAGASHEIKVRSLLIVSVTAVALFMNRPTGSSIALLGRIAGWLSLTTLGFAGVSQLAWTVPATAESKAFLGHDLLSGTMSQGNTLAIVVAAGAPLIWAAYSGLPRVVMAGSAIAVVALSGSRTSLAALLTVAVVIGARSVLSARLAQIFAAVTAVALVVATVTVPYLASGPKSFTDRGLIWQTAMSQWDAHALFGQGPYFFGLPSTTAALHQKLIHGHNAYVSTRTEIGLLGSVALLAVVAFLIRKSVAAFATSPAPMYFVISLLALGVMETPIRLDTVNDQGWIVWMGLVLIACVPFADELRPSRDRIDIFEIGGHGGVYQHAVELGSILSGAGQRVVLHTASDAEFAPPSCVEVCPCVNWHRSVRIRPLRLSRMLAGFIGLAVHLRLTAPRTDVISIQGADTRCSVLAYLLSTSGQRVSFTPHNTFSRRNSAMDLRILRAAARRADDCVVFAPADVDVVAGWGGTPTLLPLVFHVPRPTAAAVAEWRARFDPAGTTGVVGFVGQIRADKRPGLFVDMMAHLPEWRGVIVGQDTGALADARARAAGLGDRVRIFDAFLELEEFNAAVSACDVVVTPYERASGSAVLEVTRQLGVRSVASAVGGLANAATMAVAGDDPASYAAAVRKVFADERPIGMTDDVAEVIRHYTAV